MKDVNMSPSGYNASANMRQGVKLFTQIALWRKPKQQQLTADDPKTDHYRNIDDALAYHVMETTIKPGAILEYLSIRKLGKDSYLGLVTRLPSDKKVPVAAHFYHFKYGKATHMAVRGFQTVAEVEKEIKIFGGDDGKTKVDNAGGAGNGSDNQPEKSAGNDVRPAGGEEAKD